MIQSHYIGKNRAFLRRKDGKMNPFCPVCKKEMKESPTSLTISSNKQQFWCSEDKVLATVYSTKDSSGSNVYFSFPVKDE